MFYVMCSTFCVCMFLCLLYAPSHQNKFQVGANLLGNKYYSDSDSTGGVCVCVCVCVCVYSHCDSDSFLFLPLALKTHLCSLPLRFNNMFIDVTFAFRQHVYTCYLCVSTTCLYMLPLRFNNMFIDVISAFQDVYRCYQCVSTTCL